MENTGTYWQSLYVVLMAKGFEVLLYNGKLAKNIKGKKPILKTANGYKRSTHWGYYQ